MEDKEDAQIKAVNHEVCMVEGFTLLTKLTPR